MWGCILVIFSRTLKYAVPSLYVRVYHANGLYYQRHKSSLIICEGVSPPTCIRSDAFAFPHYMWGCIDNVVKAFNDGWVPSLYVRVYHFIMNNLKTGMSSLIICEGVSDSGGGVTYGRQFPHYMWGCIDIGDCFALSFVVPSLYVRVYRNSDFAIIPIAGSLIICEGVSDWLATYKEVRAFPHYMWGCIEKDFVEIKSKIVPSLYVRVYRACLVRRLMCIRSLTIHEGVSRRQIVGKTEAEFPHYTWGCIITLPTDEYGSYVPSLYVRVYHPAPAGFAWRLGSLTIYEGVSTGKRLDILLQLFPHYTWGYIK